MAKQVWSEKWRELSSSWDSEGEGNDGLEGSTGNQDGEGGNLNDVDSNGIRRSGRPRRAAAKAASGDISGLSDDEPPSKKRGRSSATPSRSRAVNERRQAESQTRPVPLNKADEKRLRKRETNKNSARKMRLQRKEELAMLLKEKHTLVDQVAEKSKELKRLYASMNALQQSNNEMEVGFHNLQRSNEMLVEELLQHITFLRNAGGKVLDPHAIPPIIARFAKCLTAEEANQMMDGAEEASPKRRRGRGRDRDRGGSPEVANGEEEDRTVYIRVDPRPGTNVQIIKPHAMKPAPSRMGSQSNATNLSLPTNDDHLPTHFQATRPRTGPSKQLSAGHASFLLPRASSPSVQTPNPSMALPPAVGQMEAGHSPHHAAEPLPPLAEPPLLRLASDLAEGAASLPEDVQRREGSHPGSAQLRVTPSTVAPRPQHAPHPTAAPSSHPSPYNGPFTLDDTPGPHPGMTPEASNAMPASGGTPAPQVALPSSLPESTPDFNPAIAATTPAAPNPHADMVMSVDPTASTNPTVNNQMGQVMMNGGSNGAFVGFQPVRGMTRLA